MIYADENVWLPVVEGLRRRGWAVTTALEEGMLGIPDVEHLRHAAENDWISLTFDDDFLRIADSDAIEVVHPGVIYASQHRSDVGELVRRIDDVLHRNEGDTLDGQVLFV